MTATEIKALARMIDRVDYYRLLKIEPGAADSQVRAAYHDARRRFHPDSFLSEVDEVRQAIDHIARRITEGYLVLRDRKRRAAYDNALEAGHVRLSADFEEDANTASAASRGTTAHGKRFLQMSEDAEREGELPKAVQNLKMALTLEPKNEGFRLKLADLEARLKESKKKR